MDESDAFRIARGAVQDAMTKQGDDRERAIQVLHEMADRDPHLGFALAMVGLANLKAEQAIEAIRGRALKH
ncbi:hypothetical protein RA280_19655 [Cupriavidus sp. CV2]|uniref:hypothetical protein n=1 Tax=Cupriavidus ulmosensis TaxID=3065913 RepID=UPI00296AF169|nr:hypothetical protein [Cupriavidus sp. CV2]MDW3683919.1 hypothetical protein [Cupriavidus sp. CV2]